MTGAGTGSCSRIGTTLLVAAEGAPGTAMTGAWPGAPPVTIAAGVPLAGVGVGSTACGPAPLRCVFRVAVPFEFAALDFNWPLAPPPALSRVHATSRAIRARAAPATGNGLADRRTEAARTRPARSRNDLATTRTGLAPRSAQRPRSAWARR